MNNKIPTIEIRGNKATIINDNNYIFFEGLDLELSYIIAGSEFSKAYLIGRWDGRRRLLSSNLTFPIGLVDRVVDYYKSNKKEINVIDYNKYSKLSPIDIEDRLKELNKIPRYYQVESAAVALKKKRGIIKVCTGGGKTLIAALLIAAIGQKTAFYVVGKDLLWQSKKFFEQVFQRPIGIVGDGMCDLQDISVISIWTAGKAFGMGKKVASSDDEELGKEKDVKESYYEQIKTFIHSAKVNIMDEVHMAAAETMQRISSEIKGEFAIGMSASPYRDDKADILIESIFGKVIVNIPASELIDKGFLVKPIIRFLPVSKSKDVVENNYRAIYKNCIVNNKERNDLILRVALKLIEQNFVIMILYKEIAHGKLLYESIRDKNIKCEILSGNDSTEDRQKVINSILNDSCKLVLASSIFDIGIDLPNLSALILAGGGKSSIRAIQRIGRVIRLNDGKDIAVIIDFHDKIKYLYEHYLIRKRIYQSEPGFEILE